MATNYVRKLPDLPKEVLLEILSSVEPTDLANVKQAVRGTGHLAEAARLAEHAHQKKLEAATACLQPPSCTPRTAPSLRALRLAVVETYKQYGPLPNLENHDTSAITASIDDGDGSAPFLLDGSKAVKLSFPMGSLRTCLIADTLPDSTKVFVTASENKIEIKTALSHISIVKKTRTEPWRVNSTHYNSEPDAVRAFLHGMRETGTTPPRAADSMHAIMEQTILPYAAQVLLQIILHQSTKTIIASPAFVRTLASYL